MAWTRISTRALSGICYRIGTSLQAGVDIRRSLEREPTRNRGVTGRTMAFIRDQVAGGNSFGDAIALTGNFFPRIVQPMVRIGETTGRLDQILLKLSEYYDHLIRARQQLMRSIAWPMIQLGLTLFIVGLLIVIPTMLPRTPDGQLQDLIGWGLVGYPGLVTYLTVLATLAIIIVVIRQSFRRETVLARTILAVWERLPIVGSPLTELAIGRVAWSLSLTTNTAMPLQESIALALDASMLPRLSRTIGTVQADVTQGSELHTAFRKTRQLPAEFLDIVEVGEETGNLPEAMERLSRNYEERSRAAIQRLGVIGGFLVWVAVAILIISLIFRLYGNYVQALQGLM